MIHKSIYAPIFEPLKNKKISLIIPWGNVGDILIEKACYQLMKYYGIFFTVVGFSEVKNTDFTNCEELVICGGGNMGSRMGWQPGHLNIKEYLLSLNKPITVLPQSYTDSADLEGYKKIWVREKESLKWAPNALVAHDLSLSYEIKWSIKDPTEKEGVWLREDCEQPLNFSFHKRSLGDPICICKTVEQYINLAATYEEIITNRLHFAIAGLLIGRRVTLLANSYYKNQAVYENSLKELGCLWIS